MASRRAFLRRCTQGAGALVGVASITSTAPAISLAAPQPFPTESQPLIYRDYRLFWTGWKAAQDHTWGCGQWIAWPLIGHGQAHFPARAPYLYLSVPGFIGGPYRPGSVFNICNRDRVMMEDTPVAQRDRWVLEGQGYLQQLVDAYRGMRAADLHDWDLYEFPLPARVIVRG